MNYENILNCHKNSQVFHFNFYFVKFVLPRKEDELKFNTQCCRHGMDGL